MVIVSGRRRVLSFSIRLSKYRAFQLIRKQRPLKKRNLPTISLSDSATLETAALNYFWQPPLRTGGRFIRLSRAEMVVIAHLYTVDTVLYQLLDRMSIVSEQQ